MKPTLKKVLLLTLFVLAITALFVVGASAATTETKEETSVASLKIGDEEPYAYAASLGDAITAANEATLGEGEHQRILRREYRALWFH